MRVVQHKARRHGDESPRKKREREKYGLRKSNQLCLQAESPRCEPRLNCRVHHITPSPQRRVRFCAFNVLSRAPLIVMTMTKVSIAPISTLAAEVSNHLTRKHVCNLLPAAATLGREPPAVPYRGLWHLCRGKARLATFCADRSAAISAARQAGTTKDSSLGAVWGIAAAQSRLATFSGPKPPAFSGPKPPATRIT